ncbi:hypothetical protein TCAL_00130, partial [Tigriopus californicus]
DFQRTQIVVVSESWKGGELRINTVLNMIKQSLSPSAVFLLTLASLSSISTGVSGGTLKDANYHVATGNQMILRQDDGQVKFGVNTGNSYRSEMRQPTGVVKGVYSWLKPDGSPQTIAYANDANGYRAIPVNQMGLQLPAFPYSLYHPGQAHPRTHTAKVTDDMVVIEGNPLGTTYGVRGDDQNQSSDEPIENEAIVVEAGGPDASETEESDPGQIPDLSQFIPVPFRPGQPVAQALPEASSIAGDFGLAQSTPGATAIAGVGGIAIALPLAEAISGNGGLALGSASANSQVQDDGIALSGGNTLAVAGVRPLDVTGGVQNNENGSGSAPPASYQIHVPNRANVAVYPVVSNHYYGSPPYTKQYSYHQPALMYNHQQSQYHYNPQLQQQQQQQKQQPFAQGYFPFVSSKSTNQAINQFGIPSQIQYNHPTNTNAQAPSPAEDRSGDFYPLPFSKLKNHLGAKTYQATDSVTNVAQKKFHPKKYSVSRRTYSTGNK